MLPRTNNCIWNQIYFHLCAGLEQLTHAAFPECSVLIQYTLNNSHVTHKMKTGMLITYLWAFVCKYLFSLKMKTKLCVQIQETREKDKKPKFHGIHPKSLYFTNKIHIRNRMLSRFLFYLLSMSSICLLPVGRYMWEAKEMLKEGRKIKHTLWKNYVNKCIYVNILKYLGMKQ